MKLMFILKEFEEIPDKSSESHEQSNIVTTPAHESSAAALHECDAEGHEDSVAKIAVRSQRRFYLFTFFYYLFMK